MRRVAPILGDAVTPSSAGGEGQVQRLLGKPTWLELNTQRVAEAQRFYTDCFGWGAAPCHLHPWGNMPMLSNREREFANLFMAMGAFAPSQWLHYFSAELEPAFERAQRLGGTVHGTIGGIDGWGRSLCLDDPEGTRFNLFENEAGDRPDPSPGGDPITAELYAADGKAMAEYYGTLLGLEILETERGFALRDGDATRLHVRTNPYCKPPNRWIPYFRSGSVGADQRRVQLFGAIRQTDAETVDQMGTVQLFADPCGAHFGLLELPK